MADASPILDTQCINIDVDLCADGKQKHTLDKQSVTLENNRFLNRLPFFKVQYHQLRIEVDSVDEKLDIRCKKNLIHLKSGKKTGNPIDHLYLKKNKADFDIILDTGEITNFKKLESSESNVKFAFSLKGSSHPQKPEIDIKKYEVRAKVRKAEPSVNIIFTTDCGVGSVCSQPLPNERTLIGRLCVACQSKSKCVFPVDILFKCRLDNYIDDEAVFFGNPEECEFTGSGRCFDPEIDGFFFKDKNGYKLKVIDYLSQRPRRIEFRDLMPDNIFYVPIFIDISKIENSQKSKKVQTERFTLIVDSETRCNTKPKKAREVMKSFNVGDFKK